MWNLLSKGQKVAILILLPVSWFSIIFINGLIKIPDYRIIEMLIGLVTYFIVPFVLTVAFGLWLAAILDYYFFKDNFKK